MTIARSAQVNKTKWPATTTTHAIHLLLSSSSIVGLREDYLLRMLRKAPPLASAGSGEQEASEKKTNLRHFLTHTHQSRRRRSVSAGRLCSREIGHQIGRRRRWCGSASERRKWPQFVCVSSNCGCVLRKTIVGRRRRRVLGAMMQPRQRQQLDEGRAG